MSPKVTSLKTVNNQKYMLGSKYEVITTTVCGIVKTQIPDFPLFSLLSILLELSLNRFKCSVSTSSPYSYGSYPS